MRSGIVGACFAALTWPTFTHAAIGLRQVRVDGSAFRVTLSDGRVLRSTQLVGAVLSVRGPHGAPRQIRIDAVAIDPDDPDGETLLHALSVRDPKSGTWTNLCKPGPDGVAKAFPMSGSWTQDGRHLHDRALTLICSGGAIGKCVRWGYKPWRADINRVPLWDYHQACVRMVRADYGGDGLVHTRNGTSIDLFDHVGIRKPVAAPGALKFEAAWGPNGAICVHKPRVSALVSLAELEKGYPALRGRTGKTCREDGSPRGALLFNRS